MLTEATQDRSFAADLAPAVRAAAFWVGQVIRHLIADRIGITVIHPAGPVVGLIRPSGKGIDAGDVDIVGGTGFQKIGGQPGVLWEVRGIENEVEVSAPQLFEVLRTPAVTSHSIDGTGNRRSGLSAIERRHVVSAGHGQFGHRPGQKNRAAEYQDLHPST